jgi:hypothetical protein
LPGAIEIERLRVELTPAVKPEVGDRKLRAPGRKRESGSRIWSG